MTDKRNKNLPCLTVMAAVLLSALAAGGPQAMDYWTANAERSGVVHAGNGREAVVLSMPCGSCSKPGAPRTRWSVPAGLKSS
jgi:hypothetical protein